MSPIYLSLAGRAWLTLTIFLIVLLGLAVVFGNMDLVLAAEPIPGQAPASPSAKGTVVMIAEAMWVMRDENGKGVLLQVSQATKIEGTIAVGDKVEAQVSPDGQALSIKKVSK